MKLTKTTRWACPNCSGDYFEHPVFLEHYVDSDIWGRYEFFCPKCGCHSNSPEDDICLLFDETDDTAIAA